MTEATQSGLTEQERATVDVCPKCGQRTYRHTDISRDFPPAACRLSVGQARVAAVESIVAARVAALRAEIATQIEADRDASGLESLPSHIRIPVHIAYDECALIARGGSGE